jgi:hypothetical protein
MLSIMLSLNSESHAESHAKSHSESHAESFWDMQSQEGSTRKIVVQNNTTVLLTLCQSKHKSSLKKLIT